MADHIIDQLNRPTVEPKLLRDLATITSATTAAMKPGLERSESVCDQVLHHLVSCEKCGEGIDAMDLAFASTARILALNWWIDRHRSSARWYGNEALFKAASTEPLCLINGQATFDPEWFQEALALSSGQI